MIHHVKQSALQPFGGEHKRAQEDVAEVAHGGVGQPALHVPLANRHGAAEHDAEHGHDQADRLRPGAAHQIRAEAVVAETDDREGARLDHRHRVQQGRDRGGGYARRGQPVMEGEDGRLDAKAQETQHKHGKEQLHRRVLERRDAAGDEVGVAGEVHHRGQREEGHRRAAQRVVHILAARVDGLRLHAVHDQEQRCQGQQLVEDVEGHQVLGEGDAQRDRVAEQVEAEEVVFPALVRHVLKGVQRGKRPQEGHQPAKDAPQPVELEADGEQVGQPEQRDGMRARRQYAPRDAGGGGERRGHGQRVAGPHVAGPPDEQRDRAQNGQQNGNQQHISARLSFTAQPPQRRSQRFPPAKGTGPESASAPPAPPAARAWRPPARRRRCPAPPRRSHGRGRSR